MTIYFPFITYWQFYLTFSLFVLLLLFIDLGIFHKNTHTVSIKEASIWSVVWIGLALLFGFGFYQYSLNKFTLEGLANAEQLSRQLTLEYYTGFIVEKALAIDNIFVFVVIFNFFSIPLKYQHKILFYGILGALFFRAIFIALGSILMQYHTLVLIFGVFLILTGIKIIFSPDKEIDPSENIVLKWLTKRFPITSEIEGDKFIVRKSGKTYITPLLLALAFVEFSDIIFAVDSVPAIFAITKEPFIVFTSNIFAILGLRSLYFILAGVVDKFHLLKYGLGIVLVFVGLKMSYLNELFDGKFPISWSLIIISFLISVSIILSLTFPKKEKILNN